MNFKNWTLENAYLDGYDLTLHYKGALCGNRYEGYIVRGLHNVDEDEIEDRKSEILTRNINRIITKPRWKDLPIVLKDMYSNHEQIDNYMIEYELTDYAEDMAGFTDADIDKANDFMEKYFEEGSYSYFCYKNQISKLELYDGVIMMYGAIWEQVDFSERNSEGE